ncbi:fungal-specific transcription factor domain-containing protein [Aspergillus spinulosporus]
MDPNSVFAGPNRPGSQQWPQHRRKRAQVARACGSCRIRHIKCDNRMPCSNCAMSGNDCSNRNASASLTLSQAHQEIAALRRKVIQLEAELESRSSNSTHQMELTPTPSTSSSAGAEVHSECSKQPGYWGGVQFRPGRSTSSRPVWLGPSSLYSYVQRLSAFLSLKLHQEHPADQLLPIFASDNKLLDRPSADLRESAAHQRSSSTCEHSPKPVYLTPIQEDYFISYFWQTYHVSLFPILDEAQFKRHYQSLWIAGGKERRESPLVDIVVAMCMQYHISTLPLESQGFLVDGKDALVAGRWHYWRGQTLLTYELESPSLSTLQCHLLCAVYLCDGSFHNMLDIAVSNAVRTAYTLGLHVDPPSSMPGPERELRRRLWWAVYVMDSKAGMKLGRPFNLDDTHAMPALPSDTFEAATMSGSGSAFVPIDENTTWLSFNLHQTKLYMTIRAAHNAFYSKDFHLQDGQTIWDDPRALQDSANVLSRFSASLQVWCDNVPNALRLLRQGNGKPFSTDPGSASFVLEQFAPPWLQRQRVLLELSYHHLCINLYRPMISFRYRSSPGSLIEELAMRCIAHAVSLTRITHQVLQETSILDGWHEAFYFQWNAAMTLIGAIMVSPFSPAASDIKSALGLAVSVSENIGARIPVAANAMKIIRCLLCKVEILEHAQYFNPDQHGYVDYSEENLWEDLSSLPREQGYSFSGVSVPHIEDGNGSTSRSELELLDLAGDVDFWNSVDMLWPETYLDYGFGAR